MGRGHIALPNHRCSGISTAGPIRTQKTRVLGRPYDFKPMGRSGRSSTLGQHQSFEEGSLRYEQEEERVTQRIKERCSEEYRRHTMIKDRNLRSVQPVQFRVRGHIVREERFSTRRLLLTKAHLDVADLLFVQVSRPFRYRASALRSADNDHSSIR